MHRHLLIVLAALPAVLYASTPAAALAPELEVERLGEPTIEDGNNYSENTRIRVRLVYPPRHPLAGRLVTGYRGTIRIEEWNTQIYDGLYGASRLPRDVRAPDGEVEIVLKSLARYAHFDMRNMPVPQIAVHAGAGHRLLQIPQWVDTDGNDKTDWLEHRVEDLLGRARASAEPPVAQAAAALHAWEQSYKRDCGGFDESRPGVITISAACLDWDGLDSHRINRHRELTATVLHELHHVWRYATSATDPRQRRLTKAPPLQVAPIACPSGCTGPVVLADQRYAADEADAEAFAERYKHLLP